MSDATVHMKSTRHKNGGEIVSLVVDNQARLNAVSRALCDEIAAQLTSISDRADVRCVVLTGAGPKAFIGGADLNELGAANADTARLFITSVHKACDAVRTCPVPVIAKINGFCLGAGLEIAAACDMRAAPAGAVFGMPEVHLGLPSVVEAALLPGLIGWGKTREILLTGDTFSGEDAKDMGLIEALVAPEALDARIDSWCESICRAAPLAVRSQKALMARWEASSVAEGVKAGIDALSDAYLTGEPQARIEAFFANKCG